jgi:CRP/FNR family transcriptional regulator, cyclic AMP receptor protein
MPSAQQEEFEEPVEVTVDQPEVDLHSLLHELRGSKNNSLNSLYGAGKVLFAEGEPARGVYILRTGRVTVSISSSEGRVVMLRMAQAGDVLGLNSVLRNCAYDTTVKTLEPCRIDFISREELFEFMRQSHAGAEAILAILSYELTELTERAKLLLLPQKVSGRLARLLLKWSKENGRDGSHSARLDKAFTHDEIAQMICSSRETVTRLLATLSKQQVIHITSNSILIRDHLALERMGLG